MTQIKGEYKGYEIHWIDYEGFRITLDHEVLKEKMQDIESCEKWIDRMLKKKFKRTPVIVRKYNWGSYEFIEGEVTSILDDGGDKDVWFISKDKKRSKEQLSTVYLDIPENIVLINQIGSLNNKIEAIKEKIKDKVANLRPLRPEDIELK